MPVAGVVLCAVLVLTAVIGGYFFAKDVLNNGLPWKRTVQDNQPEGQKNKDESVSKPAGTGKQDGSADGTASGEGGTDGGLFLPGMSPSNFIFVYNSESGRIDHILLERLNSANATLKFIRIAPEISYFASPSLYSKLSVNNTDLPQQIVYSELNHYYSSDGTAVRPYEAGAALLAEQLGVTSDIYYTAMTMEELRKYISLEETISGTVMMLNIQASSALNDYGTPGTAKGILSQTAQKSLTDFTAEKRLAYLEVYDAMSINDVTFCEAPVIEKNETCELDIAGTAELLGL